jgi:hypothetical protein
VGLNFGSQKKLRTVTGAVICRKDLALIHDRDMLRHKARGERRAWGPMRSGSCNLDAVFDSSAIAASSHGLIIVGLRAGSGGRSGDWLLLKGRCGFRRWPAWESIMLFFLFLSFDDGPCSRSVRIEILKYSNWRIVYRRKSMDYFLPPTPLWLLPPSFLFIKRFHEVQRILFHPSSDFLKKDL